jgi:hypothetical protein
MNEICELWNLPWHALQRNLAMGLSGDAAAQTAATLKPLCVQSVAVSATTWLSRARRLAAPLQAGV